MVKKTVWCLVLYGSFVYPANLVFDIGGVLQRPNSYGITQMMGWMNLAKYIATFHNPARIKQRWFEALATIKDDDIPQDAEGASYRGGPAAPIFAAWIRGDLPCATILERAERMINREFETEYERAIFRAIALTTFDIPTHIEMTQLPIKEAFDLVDECARQVDADGNPKHRLFILTNYNNEAWAELLRQDPNRFAKFEGCVVSGNERVIKPNLEIYRRLLDRYDLQPEETYFIDDQLENVTAAEQLGIQGVLFPDYDYAKLRAYFVNRGILPQ